jgi:hypothetical protein
MDNDILYGATNQFNFPELPNSRIILSEKVYRRLSADINLCAFSGNKELEYGTFLYGKEIKPNVIYFDIPSKYLDYEPSFRKFEVNTDKYGNELGIHKELMNNINQSKYDCIAHIHTHPYIGGTCRFFSNQDLRAIQNLQKNFQPDNGNKKYFFGGLLTVGEENIGETDEISFVFYDENFGWHKITNITVFLNNQEVSLKREEQKNKMSL